MKPALPFLLLALLPVPGQAAPATYQCSVSADNGIGVGVEIVLELLNERAANVSVLHTGRKGEKVSPVPLKNHAQVSREGNVLHFSAALEGSGVERGRTVFDLDLSSLRLFLAGSHGTLEMSIPCKDQVLSE